VLEKKEKKLFSLLNHQKYNLIKRKNMKKVNLELRDFFKINDENYFYKNCIIRIIKNPKENSYDCYLCTLIQYIEYRNYNNRHKIEMEYALDLTSSITHVDGNFYSGCWYFAGFVERKSSHYHAKTIEDGIKEMKEKINQVAYHSVISPFLWYSYLCNLTHCNSQKVIHSNMIRDVNSSLLNNHFDSLLNKEIQKGWFIYPIPDAYLLNEKSRKFMANYSDEELIELADKTQQIGVSLEFALLFWRENLLFEQKLAQCFPFDDSEHFMEKVTQSNLFELPLHATRT
jgi:hypothetical protein